MDFDREDSVGDLLNDNLHHENELPSGDEGNAENVFGENLEEGAAAEDDPNSVKIEPKKRTVRNPRHRLTEETLRGSRGIHTIEQYFKDIKFKGKGYEKQDLDEILSRLQHWGHRMFPNYKFDDVVSKIELLSKKKPLQVHMSRYRLDMLDHLQSDQIHDEIVDDNEAAEAVLDEPFDEFDALLDEQIAISKLAPRTPAASNRNLNTPSTSTTVSFDVGNAVVSTPYSGIHRLDTSDLAQPLPPSQPATPQPATKQLTSEQLARIAENRRLAQERLRIKKQQNRNEKAEIEN